MPKKNRGSIPSKEQLLQFLSGRRSTLLDVLHPKEKRRMTMLYVAKVFGTTMYTIRKLLMSVHDDEAFSKLRWGKGRPEKQLGLSQEQRSWLTSRRTLKQQVGKSLSTRAKLANEAFGSNINDKDLRKIYRIGRITKQKIQSQLKPKNSLTVPQQLAAISKLKAELRAHVVQRAHLMQYDACLFSLRSFNREQWAPVADPLLTNQMIPPGANVVCVFGVISVEYGKVLMHIEQKKAFTKKDVMKFLS